VRIHVLSDLHNEFAPFVPPTVAADVTVLAGDTDIGKKGVGAQVSELRGGEELPSRRMSRGLRGGMSDR